MDIRNFFGGAKKNPTPKKTREPSTADNSSNEVKKSSVEKKLKTESLEANKKVSTTSSTISPNTGRDDATRTSKQDPSPETNGKSSSQKETTSKNITKKEEGDHKHLEQKDAKKRKLIIEESDDDTDMNDKDEDFQPTKTDLKVVKEENDNEEEYVVDTPSKKKSPKRKAEPKSSSPKKSRKTPVKKAKEPPVRPSESIAFYASENAAPGILEGYTFVFTGNMDNFSREEATDYVKCLGGRVTTAVSGKTNYLVTGSILEDGRPVEEGSKYKKALELGDDKIAILQGPGEFYGLVKLLDERAGKVSSVVNPTTPAPVPSTTNASTAALSTSKTTASNPYANPYAKTSGSSVSNPYAKQPVSNPYAKASGNTVTNPYASKPSMNTTNPYAQKKPSSSVASSASMKGGGRADVNDPNALWADKYAPSNSHMVLGNKDCVTKLQTWLKTWERTFNTGGKIKFHPKNGPFRACLISGPPGIGKTTSAVLVAQEDGRQVLELNASDARSKKLLESSLSDVTGCQVLSFNKSNKNPTKRCIIMDEVDGMGAGDRGGMAELITLIKSSKVPIICICNDRQSPKVKSLANHCLDLRFKRPVKTVIARRAVEVGKAEGMEVELNAAEAIAESCGNDIRQVLNCLQMWGNKKVDGQKVALTYRDYKERDSMVNKDEILRIGLFDAAKMIVEGRRGLTDATEKAQVDSLFARMDAFFSDYSTIGLLVHQNYLKCATVPFQKSKSANDSDAELDILTRMYDATEAMSDFSIVEHEIRSGDQNWGLLPLCSALAVKIGYHIGGQSGGFLGGFPEFTTYLGRNSTRGKRSRLLQEFSHHMNYRISADNTELRMGYLPLLRDKFEYLLFRNQDGPSITEVIALMDEYGLDRDDLMENLDEFNMNSFARKFSDLDSKSKSAFTREYNKGVHKSQALVDEQGVVTRKRKKVSDDEDIEEDGQESDDNDEEEDEEEIKKMFQKNAKKSKGGAKAKKSK
jgi:replication factor C subunit 1